MHFTFCAQINASDWKSSKCLLSATVVASFDTAKRLVMYPKKKLGRVISFFRSRKIIVVTVNNDSCQYMCSPIVCLKALALNRSCTYPLASWPKPAPYLHTSSFSRLLPGSRARPLKLWLLTSIVIWANCVVAPSAGPMHNHTSEFRKWQWVWAWSCDVATLLPSTQKHLLCTIYKSLKGPDHRTQKREFTKKVNRMTWIHILYTVRREFGPRSHLAKCELWIVKWTASPIF